jgi:predicted RNA binding protein YcfA (HicA-like mRNA interferase family)
VPGLKCSFREFMNIIKDHGFLLMRHDSTSHQRWKRVEGEKVYYIDIACHNEGKNIPTGTLQSMIRQSGLPKKLFRK